MAAVKSSEGFLELLLPQYVANVDVPMQARCDDSGEKIEDYTYVTALHLACMKGFESCVKFLLVSQTEHAEMAVYTALNDGCCLTGWSNLFFFFFQISVGGWRVPGCCRRLRPHPDPLCLRGKSPDMPELPAGQAERAQAHT